MIKVLYILDSLNRGGAEVLMLDILRNAKSVDIDACVVACSGGDLEQEFNDLEIDCLRLPRRHSIDPGLILGLRRIIKSRKIEIVHVQQPVEALHAFLAARGVDTKLAFTHPGWFQDRKNRMVLPFLAPRFDANIVVSEDTKDRLIDECGKEAELNLHLIPSAVDEKRLECSTKNLRQELELDEGSVLIGMIANFYSGLRKDHQTVCRAIARLCQSHPQVHLGFVGGKQESAPRIFDDCVRLCADLGIADRVHFLGKRADIPDVLNSLDIFLLSSLHEGLPVALVAAMIVGLPCVASDIAPHCEISGEGKYLRLFKTGDDESLATVLQDLLDNSHERERLRSDGQRFALSEFSIGVYLARLRNVYEGLTRWEASRTTVTA